MEKIKAVDEFLTSEFDGLPGWLIFERPDCWNLFWCEGIDEETGEYGPVGAPMWNMLFRPNNEWLREKLIAMKEEVAECGFTLVFYDDGTCDDEDLVALGVDGCGYSFLHEHFLPLYDLLGFHWHTEVA